MTGHDQTDTDPSQESSSSDSQQWLPETVLREIKNRPEPGTSSPIPFFHIIERLKTTNREGWNRFEVKRPESISDHMYRMACMTMLAPSSLRSKLNLTRCTQMALVHDMAEALVGDITPVDGVPKVEKSRRERTTMDFFCQDLLGKVDDGVAGAEIRELWEEYEDGKTAESVFVHDIDKIELLLQMVEYERSHAGELDVGEFTWVAQAVKLPECRGWIGLIFAEREALWKIHGKTPSGFTMDEMRKHWDETDAA